MDQQASRHQSNQRPDISKDAVLCRIDSAADLVHFGIESRSLEQVGFTGIVVPADQIVAPAEALGQHGFTIHSDEDLSSPLDLSNWSGGALNLWSELEQQPESSYGIVLGGPGESLYESTILLQLSSKPIPVVPVDRRLMESPDVREQRDLLRSLVFWRKRFGLAQFSPTLVHAGDDGLLIFTIDSWLVLINQNPDEASIDLGSHGSMWLMIGTDRDVHLHGAMLILPAYSGAIVANELAR